MPVVSVIVLAWNSGDYLRISLGSMLDQTMGDLEVLLVDNGSTDGAVERALAARPDPRVRVLRQETNLGVVGGTRAAIAVARSPWIAIMDSDDWSHPMRLELQLQAARADPELAVIGTGARWMDEAGKPGEAYPMYFEPHEIAAYVPFNMPVLHPTLMFRRAVLEEISYRPGVDICADYDLVSRVVERHRIGVVSLPLLHYRRHAASSTISRATYSQAGVCAIRLAIARRRAGRTEDFAGLMASAQRWREPGLPVAAVYRHYARQAADEGFPLLAAFHAALACRAEGGFGNQLRYLRHLAAAFAADRTAWKEGLGGIGKGPFWMLLRRAGFPPFPRY